MAKKLTDGQRLARAAVRAAARDVIKKLDELECRRECVFFETHFHLKCWRFDRGHAFGRPIQSGMPVYAYAWSGRREPSVEERDRAWDSAYRRNPND